MLISFFSTCGLSSVDRVDRVDEDVGGTDKLLRRRGDCQEMFTMSGVIPRSYQQVHFRCQNPAVLIFRAPAVTRSPPVPPKVMLSEPVRPCLELSV